ncbi:hypothetical protein [Methylogaea oryzae]|nr:hypothetical protein [Methylogaea oryzae]
MLSSLAMLYFLEYGPDRNQPLTVKEASDIVQSMLLFLVGLVIARRW